jgi:hypothetical protein
MKPDEKTLDVMKALFAAYNALDKEAEKAGIEIDWTKVIKCSINFATCLVSAFKIKKD